MGILDVPGITRNEMYSAFGEIAILATPDQFPAIDNTGATLTHTGIQEVLNAAPYGATVKFMGQYLTSAVSVVPPEKFLKIDGQAATFIRAGSAMVFRCESVFDTEYGITAFATESITIDGQPATVTKLTMATTPSWFPNDLIKIYSDDVISGAHVTSDTVKPRRGEFAEVLSVSGTTVYLRGLTDGVRSNLLAESYTTAPRASRLPYGGVTLTGAMFDVTDAVVSGKTEGSMFRFQNLTNAVVENSVAKRLVGMGLSFKSCYAYRVSNFNVRWGMNDPTNGVFSYGVHDSSCTNGVIEGGSQRSLRHPFTCGTGDVAAGSTDASSFGRTFNTKLVNITSHDCTAAGFDTHHMSRGIQFIGCTAYVSPEVNGFLLRGTSHSIIDCTVYGGLAALMVTTQVTGAWSQGESELHTVDNFKVVGSRRVLTVAVRGAATHPNYNVRPTTPSVTMTGVNARGVERFGVLLNGNAKITDADITLGSKADGSIIQCENSALEFSGSLDLSAVATVGTGTQRLFSVDPVAGEKSDFRIGKLKVKASAAYQAATATPTAFSSETERVLIEDFVFETPWATSAPFPIPDAVISSVKWRCLYNPTDSLSRRTSGGVGFNNAALAGSLTQLFMATDAQLVLTANITDSTPRTMGSVPVGQFDGQRLSIVMGTATAALTVQHGASFNTRLAGSVNRTLSVGNQAVHLVWSSGAWREAFDQVVVAADGSFSVGSRKVLTDLDIPRLAKSTADVVVNNSGSLVAATGLVFNVAANAVYEVEGAIIYAASTAADITFGWTYPASAAMDWSANGLSTGTTSPTSSVARQPKGISETSPIGGAGVASKIFAYPKGLLVTGATAGVLQLTFAQLVAEASDATVFAGSYLKLTRLL
jgi:hypothetical protein